MQELFTSLAELSAKAKELRADPMFGAPGRDGDRLHEAFHDLHAVIQNMERRAADLYDLLRDKRQDR